MPTIKICPVCGKKISSKNGTFYCCDICRRIQKSRQNLEYQRAARRARVYKCARCGTEMAGYEVYYKDNAEENWIFCSRKCAIATFTDKFFAMKDAGIIVDKLDDLDIGNVNVVR